MQDAVNQPTILLLGGSGFVGSALGERFASLGWKVHLVTRTKRPYQMAFPCEQFEWDGTSIPLEAIEGVQAVINLAGQPIFDNRWTADYKKKILDSRLFAGRALVAAIDKLSTPPPVVIQISGTDFYGMDPRSDVCDERAGPGEDFMAEVGMVGEEPSLKLDSVTRLCIVRMGLVLGWEGGGLPQLWDVYASGCGGKLGNGQQPTNWVHVEDVVGFCEAAILNQLDHARSCENCQANARALGFEKRARIIEGSWADGIDGTFDLIVSNPPYIPSKDIKNLSKDIINYEPLVALDGGVDGLDLIKKVIYKSNILLKRNGMLALEIGFGQYRRVSEILKKYKFKEYSKINDYNGNVRCIITTKIDFY